MCCCLPACEVGSLARCCSAVSRTCAAAGVAACTGPTGACCTPAGAGACSPRAALTSCVRPEQALAKPSEELLAASTPAAERRWQFGVLRALSGRPASGSRASGWADKWCGQGVCCNLAGCAKAGCARSGCATGPWSGRKAVQSAVSGCGAERCSHSCPGVPCADAGCSRPICNPAWHARAAGCRSRSRSPGCAAAERCACGKANAAGCCAGCSTCSEWIGAGCGCGQYTAARTAAGCSANALGTAGCCGSCSARWLAAGWLPCGTGVPSGRSACD